MYFLLGLLACCHTTIPGKYKIKVLWICIFSIKILNNSNPSASTCHGLALGLSTLLALSHETRTGPHFIWKKKIFYSTPFPRTMMLMQRKWCHHLLSVCLTQLLTGCWRGNWHRVSVHVYDVSGAMCFRCYLPWTVQRAEVNGSVSAVRKQ